MVRERERERERGRHVYPRIHTVMGKGKDEESGKKQKNKKTQSKQHVQCLFERISKEFDGIKIVDR